MQALKPKMGTSPMPVKSKGSIMNMDLFKKLPAVALAEAEKKMIEKKFARGSVIHLEGDPAEFVWFVKEGHVKAMVNTPNGRSLTLCMVGAKGMFGSCCCFSNAEYPCQGVAETDTIVYAFPMADFLDLLNRFPGLSRAVVETVSKRLRHSKGTQVFEQESVEKRILHALINLVEEFGTTIPLTRREIAEMAGTTVETCIRTFSNLESEGLVSTERGKITIPDVRALVDRKENF
jgi:CRP/FNR family transcriptional regulator